MKHLALSFLVCISFAFAYGQGAVIIQDKDFIYKHQPDSAIIRMLKASYSYQFLSPEEREEIYWINLMRKDPGSFSSVFLRPFLSQFPEIKNSASRSLEADLRSTGPLEILLPAANVHKAAMVQCKYLLESKQFGHTGAKGRSFQQRMADVGVRECAGENLFEGKSDPLVALLLLMIDNGVPGYGHRKALLNPMFNKIGLSIVEEKHGIMMMVQVFSCN